MIDVNYFSSKINPGLSQSWMNYRTKRYGDDILIFFVVQIFGAIRSGKAEMICLNR